MSFRLEIQVQPRARRNEIVGWQGAVLKLKVTAAPVDGAANRAVIELMAKALDLPRSRIALVRGETSRSKLLEIAAVESECRDRLNTIRGTSLR